MIPNKAALHAHLNAGVPAGLPAVKAGPGMGGF
jgi:hypothetical protein